MKKGVGRKAIVIGIIMLFVGAGVTPIIKGDPIIYIEGNLRVYDEVNNEWEGCFGTKVEIWDHDVIGSDLLLTLIIEEDNGHFSASVSNIDGAGGGQEIFLKFITENDYVAVSSPWNPFCYWSQTPTKPEANDYETLNFDYDIEQFGDGSGAWHIQRWLYEGYKFVSDKISSKIEAEWSSSGSEYSKFLHFFKEIRLLAGDEWDDGVILHEYGHFVMDEVYGYQPPVNYGADTPDHSFDSQETKSTAWSEGWPYFFQAAVRDNPHYYDYDPDPNLNIDWDFENRLTPEGENVEGNVVKILWDIYDSTNEVGDNLDMSFNEIWAAFSNHETSVSYPGYGDHVDEIKEFWNNWLEIYGNNNLIDLIRVFYLDRVDYRPSDSFGYKFLDNQMHSGPTYDWIEISNDGNQILPSSDDSWMGNINLGFFFNYYGTDYSQLAIGNNGLLFSGAGTSQYVNQPSLKHLLYTV
jgi:hypothetical protein